MKKRISWILLWAIGSVYSQSDNLVSKGIGTLEVLGSEVFAFDVDLLSYSRLDLFSSPARIITVTRKQDPFTAVTSTGFALLGVVEEKKGDSVRNFKIVQLNATGEKDLFKIQLADTCLSPSQALVQELKVSNGKLVFSAGKSGLAILDWTRQNDEVVPADSLRFYFFSDSTVSTRACRRDSLCSQPVNGTCAESAFNIPVGAFHFLGDSLVFFAPPASASKKGLRRWTLSGATVEVLANPDVKDVAFTLIATGTRGDLWGFTNDKVFRSLDSGTNFGELNGISPALITFMRDPSVAFSGDTALVNFDFSGGHPGISYIVRDSVLLYGTKDESSFESVLHPGLLVPLSTRFDPLLVVQNGNRKIAVAGTRSLGLYYVDLNDSLWTQINRQTAVRANLKQVMTFPTIFDGSRPVGLGYQLEKDAKVTITVFNYAMEKVRKLTSSSRRRGGVPRSEDPEKDTWDGKDDRGHFVSKGLYYVLVESDGGERGWGKVMVVLGRD